MDRETLIKKQMQKENKIVRRSTSIFALVARHDLKMKRKLIREREISERDER